MYNAREGKNPGKDNVEGGAEGGENVKATWMADGTHWPGTWYEPIADHKKGDHPGILQVFSPSIL